MMVSVIAALSACIWVGLLVTPWQPWRVRERLEAGSADSGTDLSEVTVLIPARNEASVLKETLAALRQQGEGLNVIVVDDDSDDETAQVARGAGIASLKVVSGGPLPDGWTGKLWALEQGRQYVETPLTLLLDADIELKPGMLDAVRDKQQSDSRDLVSVMAWLRMHSFWERLLIPAFIYFFRLLYPFSLSNRGVRIAAAAAGGCVMLRTTMLERIGGFGALRGALIDDCTLALRVQEAGGSTWVGATRSAVSLRGYDRLAPIWSMVARTAFTQLRYSSVWLVICTLAFALAFAGPWVGLTMGSTTAMALSLVALVSMFASYLPTLYYYGLSFAWTFLLPLIAGLYLAMTWDSALRYWRGIRSQWRGRVYGRSAPEDEAST